MGIILFIRRIISIYAIINKPTSGFVAETEHFWVSGFSGLASFLLSV
jgi:hypothetical protein